MKVEFRAKTDQFFTNGETYDAIPHNSKWMIVKDDEGDHHGLSEKQLKRWFNEV